MGLKEDLFNKFIFPKTLFINTPGIIVSKTASRLGPVSSQTRVVFFFENLFVDLYLNSVEKIGEERTKKLWYRIGKDIGIRYFLFSNQKFFVRDNNKSVFVLQIVFDILSAIGLSFAEKIMPKSDKTNFVVNGKYPLVARKINDGTFLAGIFSGILSFVYKENIEARSFLIEEGIFRTVASNNFEGIYFPEVFTLIPDKNYNHLNFPKNISNRSGRRTCSLSDLIKFNKVYFDKDSNNWMFMNEAIFPGEVGLFALIFHNYVKEGLFELISESYIFSTKKIFDNFLKDEIFLENRIHLLMTLLSGFGWGNPYLSKENKKLIFKFEYPPFSKYGFLDRAFSLNGAVNSIFGKNFVLDKASNSEFVYVEL